MCRTKKGATVCPACLEEAEIEMLSGSPWQTPLAVIVSGDVWWSERVSAKEGTSASGKMDLGAVIFLLFDGLSRQRSCP